MDDFDKLINAFGSAAKAASEFSNALSLFAYEDERYRITTNIKVLKSKQFWMGLTYLEKYRLEELHGDLFVNDVLTITIDA